MAITVKRTRSARENYLQHESYIYRRVNWNDVGINSASTVANAFQLGTLPPGALPLETIVRVTSAFDQGLTISTTASSGNVVARTDLAFGSTGVTLVDRVSQLAYSTAERPIFIAQATAGTGGQADVWLRFYQTQGAI